MKREDIVNDLGELCDKYFWLVWMARKEPEWLRDGHPSMPKMVEVGMKWPEECKELACPEKGDWTHGFNSGCLAALRYAIHLFGNKTDIKFAKDNFPDLDT